jgi:hypothetical protein
LWLDSRLSGTRRNRLGGYLAFQSRKRGVDILFTAQRRHSVEKRFRDLTDIWVVCENLDPNKHVADRSLHRPYVVMSIYDTGQGLSYQRIIPTPTALAVGGMYDTTQLIQPV